MICPKCSLLRVKVIDSRASRNLKRRRRECMNCGHRWTTVEISAADYVSQRSLPIVQRQLAKAIGNIEQAIDSVKRSRVRLKVKAVAKPKLRPVLIGADDYEPAGPD